MSDIRDPQYFATLNRTVFLIMRRFELLNSIEMLSYYRLSGEKQAPENVNKD